MRKFMYHSKKVLSTILSFAIISSTMHLTPVFAADKVSTISLDISKENVQKQEVLNKFMKTADEDIVFENPQTVAKAYIPEGSQCTEVSLIGEVLYIDYRINNVRYIVGYHRDGTVEKVARSMEEDTIYSINSSENRIDYYSVQDNIETVSKLDDEDGAYVEQVGNSEEIANSTFQVSATAATKEVYPIRYYDVSSTTPYKGKSVASGILTISELANVGYSTKQGYQVYETMSYYTQATKSSKVFAIGETLATIASVLRVAPSTAKAWLTAFDVLLSASNKLQEACKVVDEHAYTYLGGKECTIYDPTVEKKYVEVYSVWGEGKISMVWNYDSSTGYYNPTWGHTVRSNGLLTANTTMRDEALAIYRSQIATLGKWSLGVGNGIGY